jgi:hypothetical protein
MPNRVFRWQKGIMAKSEYPRTLDLPMPNGEKFWVQVTNGDTFGGMPGIDMTIHHGDPASVCCRLPTPDEWKQAKPLVVKFLDDVFSS